MTVLLLGASPLGTRAASRIGVGYHLVLRPGESTAGVVGDPISVSYLPFDTEPESVLALDVPMDVRAITSFTEPGLFPAALLAHVAGRSGTSLTAVAATRNKYAMRKRLNGVVAQPRFGQLGVDPVPDEDQVLVVKPMSGTGGLGVRSVPSSEVGLIRGTGYMWEELVRGSEFSVETVSRPAAGDLGVELIGITSKTTSGSPDFIEVAHEVPARVDTQSRSALLATVRSALAALDVRVGPAHTEVILTDRGPVIIEIQTRPGGGRIPDLHARVTGIDHYEAALLGLLDLHPLQAPAAKRPAVAKAKMLLEQPMREPSIPSGTSHVTATVVEFERWHPASTKSTSFQSNFDRHGVLVATGPSSDAVDAVLENAARTITTPASQSRNKGSAR